MSNTSRAVILTILISHVSTIAAEQKHTIPELLMNVINKYGNFKKPSNDNFEKASLEVLRKSNKHSDIADAIRVKIAELAPLLDDKKNKDRNERRDGDNEDFFESSFNPAILKYKKMRKEIENLMKLEPITDEMKRVVTEALDEIENELNHDCYWTKIGDMRRLSRGREPSIVIPKDMERKDTVIKHIKNKWDKIVNRFSMPDVDRHNDTVRKIAFVFLTRLRQFVFDTHEDYTKLQNRYEMKCFDEVNKTASPVFRPDNNQKIKNDTDDCRNIMICSEELLDFLTDFYDQLNVTFTEVFKNYVVMYLKEIDADDDEKKSFTDVLGDIEDHVRIKIKKMFTAELGKLNEVFNVSASRIDALKHLIDRTIHNAKELIYASLSIKLRVLKPKLRLTVKQDIDIATGIDLGNLKKEFKDKICSVFRHCNGDDKSRRHNKGHFNADPNMIQIRLKFGFGDAPLKLLKPYLKEIRYKSIKGFKRNGDDIKDNNILSARKSMPFNIKEFKGINVTRTTYADYVEKGATKSTNGSLKNDTNVAKDKKVTNVTNVANVTNVTSIMESSISYQL